MRDPVNDMDVFLLCGGAGRRLRAVSHGTPKPMVKVGGKPFLDILIGYLAGFGFKNFIIGTGYKAGIIEDHYRHNKIPGLSVSFSRERTPLGTGGALKKALGKIGSSPFMVVNGDSFCEFDPIDFLKFHKQKKALISILLKKVSSAGDYGSIRTDSDMRVLEFTEKQKGGGSPYVNAGIYIMDKTICKLFPARAKFSLERDLFPDVAGRRVYGYKKSGLFIDIGTPERLKEARRLLR